MGSSYPNYVMADYTDLTFAEGDPVPWGPCHDLLWNDYNNVIQASGPCLHYEPLSYDSDTSMSGGELDPLWEIGDAISAHIPVLVNNVGQPGSTEDLIARIKSEIYDWDQGNGTWTYRSQFPETPNPTPNPTEPSA